MARLSRLPLLPIALVSVLIVGMLGGAAIAQTVGWQKPGDDVNNLTDAQAAINYWNLLPISDDPSQAAMWLAFGEMVDNMMEMDIRTRGLRAVPAVTDGAGGDAAHNNLQPDLALNCIIATGGTFPSRGGSVPTNDTFLGEIKWFAGNFAPSGFSLCDGQLLDIGSNTALFSVLGTTYGGDGRTNFALPDARGRSVVHAGTGPGLTVRRLGASYGTETETLTDDQMPAHAHGIS